MWYVAEDATQYALQAEQESHEAQRREKSGEGGQEDAGSVREESVYLRKAQSVLSRRDWDDERRAREMGDLICLDTDNVA